MYTSPTSKNLIAFLILSINYLKNEYQKNGYAIVKNVISADLANQVVEHVKWLKRRNPNVRPESFHHHMLINDPFIHYIVENNKLLDIVESIIGPNIALYGAHYIAKKPIDGMPVGWHQDGSYWPLKPMNVVSVWLAGNHSKKNNGCMQLIPGTQDKHLLKPSQMKKMDLEKYVLDLAIDPKNIDESKAIDVELNPGDISIHNPFIIHGSNPNKSNKWRIGLTLRFIPTSTYVDRKNWECILLRGKNVIGVENNYIQRPNFNPKEHMIFDGMENF